MPTPLNVTDCPPWPSGTAHRFHQRRRLIRSRKAVRVAQTHQAALCLFFVIVAVLLPLSVRAAAAVVFSEIHYHPVEEPEFLPDGKPALDLSTDPHEFLELYNPSKEAVDLSGWRISGGVRYEFPQGSRILPGQFMVVAKNPMRLKQIAAYGLDQTTVFGPYDGELSNREDTLRLRDGKDRLVEAVHYSSKTPWPICADALGADDEWTGLNSRDYQHRGRSLERVSFEHSAMDPANWLASPVGGNPSPGRANAVARATPLPVVLRIGVYQAGDEQTVIRRGQPVQVDVAFSSGTELGRVELEYFVDDINRADESHTNIVMQTMGNAADARFNALIPGLPDRSVVRYRVKAERGGALEPVSPRSDDPFGWHAYFVTPARQSTKPIYDCFVSSASLSRLASNISGNPRRVTAPDPPGNPRASWNATEPAVFVVDGEVRDIRLRYHGSRYNRSPGRNSYKLQFPRYRSFQGTDALFVTDKGSDFVNGHGLFLNAGLPVSAVRYVDFYLNNNAVMQRLEQGEFNVDMLDDYHRAQQRLSPGSPLEPSGEIYKSVGTIDVNGEGPYGRGDGRLLSKPAWGPLVMYEWTYSLQSHGWRGHTDFKTMIDAYWKARGDTPASPNPNVAAMRTFFAETFDIEAMLTYLAVENWACPWDDTTQNHFLWRRSNGRWGMLPWDCDAWFGRGDNTPASASIFIGEVGDRSNNFRGPNFFKDGFLKAFRQEYKERLFLLNNTLLHPENITAMGFGSIRSFADARFTAVNQQCGLGTFQRPTKPTNLSPTARASIAPPMDLVSSAYGHSAAPAIPHARTLWEIRAADGSYREPVYREASTNRTRLHVPFELLEFGRSYYWRCTHWDEAGHPSMASEETSFVFGTVAASVTNTVSIASFDTTTLWRYAPAGTPVPANWKEAGFDDSTWPSGAGLLAVETASLPEPIRTPLTLGSISYYFRHAFTYTGPASTTLKLNQILDDGAVYYLNGREIFRSRLSTSPVTPTTLADSTVGDASLEGPFDVVVTNLVAGTNILAVEVHQSAAASSDVVFGAALSYTTISNVGLEVVINEVRANTDPVDTSGERSLDFVELHNRSDHAISLDGFSLSDNVLNPVRFRFPAGTAIGPRGFLTVIASGGTSDGGLNLGFGLDSSGQTVALFGPAVGGGIEVKDSVSFGPQAAGSSIARFPDGSGDWMLGRPTPGAGNVEQPTADPRLLRINEWMANPADGDDWFEIYNPAPLPVALGGMAFSDDPAAPSKSPIAPLSFIGGAGFVRFIADGSPAKGPSHANLKLSSNGDTLTLASTNRVVIDKVSFGTQNQGISQGRLPDGAPQVVSFLMTPSPGGRNHLPLDTVLINEVLSHSEPPLEDAIELHNATDQAVDISGWYLSDDPRQPRKFRVPAGTIVASGGFQVFYESQFNPTAPGPSNFALSSFHGDHVVLSAVDASGALTGYVDEARFGPAPSGRSFGRVNLGQRTEFALLASPSFGRSTFATVEEFRQGKGQSNGPVFMPAVVLDEVHYHPSADPASGGAPAPAGMEFVELFNRGSLAVDLFDPKHPTNTWRLAGGISFVFPTGTRLAAGGRIVVVGFDPATNAPAVEAFRTFYHLAQMPRLMGPFTGKLNNRADRVALRIPDLPEPAGSANAGEVAYVEIDRVEYMDTAPWPSTADGQGASLQRLRPDAYGNDPGNWTAASPSTGSGFAADPLDSDGDGLSDAWEGTYGLDPHDARDASLDSDGDGLSNLEEFRRETDPGDPASPLRLSVSLGLTGNQQQVRFRFWAVAGSRYQLQFRTEQTRAPWMDSGPPINALNPGWVEASEAVMPEAGGRFYRLVRIAGTSP